MSDFDLSAFLPYRLSVAAARVSQALAIRYQAEFGLSVPEWRVLAHLAGSKGAVSVRDIELAAHLEKSTVSRAVARMEAAGHVAKIAGTTDRRLLVLTLTPQGDALMSRLIPIALSYQADLLRRLGPAADALDLGLTVLEKTENDRSAL